LTKKERKRNIFVFICLISVFPFFLSELIEESAIAILSPNIVNGTNAPQTQPAPVFVVDWGNFRIQKFSSTGTFITKWGSEGTGNGQFKSTGGIAVDPFGNVFVADSDNHRIQKFKLANPCPSGTTQIVSGVCFVTKWGSPGTANGQFKSPFSIAIR
jgi:hypothetical protein